MQLKVKKLNPEATLPTYATDGSNGLDLTATGIVITPEYVEIRTAISVEIPEGYVGLLFARSSISKKNMLLANGVGVIDSDYRGEIMFRFKVLDDRNVGVLKYSKNYEQGDKVGQLIVVPIPKLEVVEVRELSDTKRNFGGFGSSDKK